MNKCTIIYGMSGSLKLTTINSKKYENSFKILSDTKPFFSIDKNYFNWSSSPNDAHLCIHRLLTLELQGYLPDNKDVIIERGITDNIFCIPNRKLRGLEDYSKINIKGLVDRELNDLSKYKLKKILLVMNDSNFITNEVLKDKYRKSLYNDVSIYMKKQQDYIDFTCKYNLIDEIIRIDNAFDYINKLK